MESLDQDRATFLYVTVMEGTVPSTLNTAEPDLQAVRLNVVGIHTFLFLGYSWDTPQRRAGEEYTTRKSHTTGAGSGTIGAESHGKTEMWEFDLDLDLVLGRWVPMRLFSVSLSCFFLHRHQFAFATVCTPCVSQLIDRSASASNRWKGLLSSCVHMPLGRAVPPRTLTPPCRSPPQGRRSPTNPWGMVTK